MDIIIHIPKGIEEQLEAAFGRDLPQAAREALAIEGYRTERLSLGQVAELLGVSTIEAEQLLKDSERYRSFTRSMILSGTEKH